MSEKKTAAEFLADNSSNEFKTKCDELGLEPTKRQVRKFRNKKGAAFKGLRKGK